MDLRTFLGHFLRPSRTIPITRWRAAHRWDLKLQGVCILIFGLAIFGLGDAFIVQAHLGNAPWTVLSQGLTLKLGISLGWATFLVSSAVLLLWIPLREKPGFGTLANIVVIATAIQCGVMVIPEQRSFPLQLLFIFIGISAVGIGSAIYITCGLGPGPRDGLMTALHHRTGVRVARVRLAIEGTVLVMGAALGGHVGLGTALFALFIGQSLAISLSFMERLTRNTEK
jgi:uncharacterized membrane protein YczE